MPAKRSTTKDRILASAYTLFYREGFSRASVDAVAAKAEVTKRTVYYHFKSKDDIVAKVLDSQHDYMMHQFRGWTDPPTAGLQQRMDNLFAHLLAWAESDGWLGSGFTRITTELADMPGHPARDAAHKHKLKVEDWLDGELADSGIAASKELACHIMVLIEGSMSLTLIHGDVRYIRSAALAAKQLLVAAES